MIASLKGLLATPFSDLWLPTLLIGALIIVLLGVHYLWLSWRVESLSKPRAGAQSNHANAYAGSEPLPIAKTPSQYPGLSDLQAFTAQKQPVTLEEQANLESAYVPTTLIVTQRLDPTFDGFDSFDEPAPAHLNAAEKLSAIDQPRPPDGVDEDVFFKPHATVLLAKPPAPAAPAIHPVFHYQARLSWSDTQGKHVLVDALNASPWTHPLPVVWSPDPQDDTSVIAAWQVASRRELASLEDAQHFKQWCETLASMSAGRCEFLAHHAWEPFLDEAHSLLIGLDSVIMLKVAVPLVQLDLFAQSLLAARFTQAQEHWCYQEHEHSTAVYLERQWQQSSAESAVNQQAVFQLILDIPHLDSLEARKIYMRLRAIARASASILQSAQGVHLSEGMLDRYSRELMMKQEALTQAQVPPGSALAKQVFKPQLSLNKDLALS
jgi:hypothetical protein